MSDAFRLVVFFAHPDDESFGFAGSMAMLADKGADLTYICATRGEVGEILVEGLTTPDELGAFREGELRAALKIIGVQHLRLLGYRDSGMEGTPENRDPRAFVNAPVPTVAHQVAEIILETKPDVFITYGPDGIYGHPDHVHVHTTAVPAVYEAADRGWPVPNLYFSAASRERVMRMAERPGNPFNAMPPEKLATFGTPAAEITTWIDASSVFERKIAAMRAHRSQMGDDGPFSTIPEETRREWLSVESARTIPTPWNEHPNDVLLEQLPEAPLDHPFRS
jgi:N-acetyl-1-D-myo-inositol-2-amino-2-deoxy-alpha-D-glucopyranoside deacetylase